jgi:hypothetical protein
MKCKQFLNAKYFTIGYGATEMNNGFAKLFDLSNFNTELYGNYAGKPPTFM